MKRTLFILFLLAGCGENVPMPIADSGLDARSDISDSGMDATLYRDAELILDAGVDLSIDATDVADAIVDDATRADSGDAMDASADAGDTDAAEIDAGLPDTDAGTDSGVEDAGTDSGTDAGPTCGSCDDGVACTIDTCVEGICRHTATDNLLSAIAFDSVMVRNETDAPLPLTGFEACYALTPERTPTTVVCHDLTGVSVPAHSPYLRVLWTERGIFQTAIRAPDGTMCDYVPRRRDDYAMDAEGRAAGLWAGPALGLASYFCENEPGVGFMAWNSCMVCDVGYVTLDPPTEQCVECP